MSCSVMVWATLVMLPASLVRVRALKALSCLITYSGCWPATRGISFCPENPPRWHMVHNTSSAFFLPRATRAASALKAMGFGFCAAKYSARSSMSFVVKLSTKDMLDLAEYFAAQKPKPIAFKADAARVARGRKKADEVLCTMCHLGGFSGQNEIPRVASQRPEYVIKQLKAFKARTRTNDAGSMTSVAQTISEQDIEDLAHYISSLD